MKVKPLPAPPADLDGVRAARQAVPLVPGSEDDCCARLVSRGIAPGRDEARRWLTLLRGLGLVEEGARGFARGRDDVDRDALADVFLAGVFGADEAVAVLEAADGPVSADDVFARLERRVPTWERLSNPDAWREEWRDRTARLLDWLDLLGLAERVDGGYGRA